MKKVKIRYRKNANGTSSIRLNFFDGYETIDGKRKAKRLIKTLPFHLFTSPKSKKEEKINITYKKEAEKIALQWEKTLLKEKISLKGNNVTKLKDFQLNSKIPEGNLEQKWSNHKGKINLVSPANKSTNQRRRGSLNRV